MSWDWASTAVTSLLTAGITGYLATRPKVVVALARAEEILRKELWAEINLLRQKLDLCEVEIDQCQEDRGILRLELKSLQDLVNKKFNTVEVVGSFFHHMPGPAWVKDVNSRMFMVNRSYEEEFGISRLSYQGRMDRDIWPEEVATTFLANDEKVLKRGRGLEFVEQVPARPWEPVSAANPLKDWSVWKFPVVVDDQLFGIGGVAFRSDPSL